MSGGAPTPNELLELALPLATEAGELALAMAVEARRSPDTKSSGTDLVTDADRAAEDLIVDGILTARPTDGIEGEEGASRPGTSSVRWHIDPIDGTTNYVYGIPAFAVSVAAELDGTVVAGVVVDPSRRHTYHATLDGGAWLDERPLTVSPERHELGQALVATGFGYQAERRARQGQIVAEVLPRVRDIRRFGAAALDLCAVATGEVDAYYELGLNRWDLAAGALIATEAGAILGDLRGREAGPAFTLAARPGVFENLRSLLAELDADDAP